MTDKGPIPNDSLDALAQTLADMLCVDTSEAMRRALRNEIERVKTTPTIDDQIETLREVVSRMWWKLPSSGLRACNVGSSQAARSRDIGTRG